MPTGDDDDDVCPLPTSDVQSTFTRLQTCMDDLCVHSNCNLHGRRQRFRSITHRLKPTSNSALLLQQATATGQIPPELQSPGSPDTRHPNLAMVLDRDKITFDKSKQRNANKGLRLTPSLLTSEEEEGDGHDDVNDDDEQEAFSSGKPYFLPSPSPEHDEAILNELYGSSDEDEFRDDTLAWISSVYHDDNLDEDDHVRDIEPLEPTSGAEQQTPGKENDTPVKSKKRGKKWMEEKADRHPFDPLSLEVCPSEIHWCKEPVKKKQYTGPEPEASTSAAAAAAAGGRSSNEASSSSNKSRRRFTRSLSPELPPSRKGKERAYASGAEDA